MLKRVFLFFLDSFREVRHNVMWPTVDVLKNTFLKFVVGIIVMMIVISTIDFFLKIVVSFIYKIF